MALSPKSLAPKSLAPKSRDYSSLFLIGFIWSLIFLANEIALRSVGPITITTGRVVLAAVLLYGYARFKGEKLPRDWQTWKHFIFIGIGITGAFILPPWAQQTLDSHVAAIIIATGPLVTMVMSRLMTRDEKITRRKTLGLVVGFSGVVVLAGGVPVAQMATDLPAQFMVFMVAVFYGVALIESKKLTHLTPLITAVGGMIVASVIMLAATFAFHPPWTVHPTWQAALAIAYLGIIVSAFGYLISIMLVKRTGATFAANFYYLVPTFAIIWGVYFLKETVNWTALVAVALILTGLGIANFSKTKKGSAPHIHHP